MGMTTSPNWGGPRRAGPGKRLGRPKSNKRTIEALVREIDGLAIQFKLGVKKGFLEGVVVMAQRFPEVMARLLARAIEDNDLEAQKFLADKFLKFFQPDLLAMDQKNSPVGEFLTGIRADIRAGGANGRPDKQIPVIDNPVGSPSPPGPASPPRGLVVDRNGQTVLRAEPLQTGDGRRTVG